MMMTLSKESNLFYYGVTFISYRIFSALKLLLSSCKVQKVC